MDPITLCSTDAAASLFAQLGGTPDAGGTWSGPSTVTGGLINPASMSAGAYVYTVTGTAPCPVETATVNVTINTPPDPGTDGTIAMYFRCGGFALRTAWRNTRCGRNLERPKCGDRRYDRSRNDERRGVCLHGHGNSTLPR
ncbi:MAG: hypothetical protein IPI95_10730 [Flavobacteriales bacterium]|nr:hypothetical protein [Flavobacteriales bacterium]